MSTFIPQSGAIGFIFNAINDFFLRRLVLPSLSDSSLSVDSPASTSLLTSRRVLSGDHLKALTPCFKLVTGLASLRWQA